MSGPVKVALVGCGRIARGRHLPILVASDRFEVVAVADPDASAREAAGRLARGGRIEAEAEAIWSDPRVEAVVIASPNPLHPGQASAAFAAGKHVYVEKPVADTLAEAETVLAAWRSAGTVGRIGFNYRFHPMHVAAREMIAEGRLGRLVAIQTCFHTPTTTLPEWKKRRASGGGALLDLASHHVDLVRFLSGREVAQTRCRIRSRESEHDTAVLELTLDDATPVQISVAMHSVDRDRIEVIGERGAVTLDRVADPVARWRPSGRAGLARRKLAHAIAAARPSLRRGRFEVSTLASLEAFARAVAGEVEARPDLDDAVACLEVLAEAERDAGVAPQPPDPQAASAPVTEALV